MALIKKICVCNGLRSVFFIEDISEIDPDSLATDGDDGDILTMDEEDGGEGLGETILGDE